MKRMESNEFVVQSMRHCFICLNPITSENGFAMNSKRRTETEPDFHPVYSLLGLSRYLKMDIGTVFGENQKLVSQHLLDKVRKSKLKGEMCLECALLNKRISEKYQNLGKIELELVSSIKELQSKLVAANEAEKTTKLRELADSLGEDKEGWRGKLNILEVLRAEATQKCSRKLSADTPRVKVLNLSPDQVIIDKQKIRSDSSRDIDNCDDRTQPDSSFKELPDPTVESGKVKTECPSIDSSSDWDDDTQSIINSDKLETSSHSSSTFNSNRRNLKSKRWKKEDDYSFDVVVPPSSSKIPKPEPTFNPITKKYKCNLCPSEREYMGQFKIHYDSAHLNVKYKCNICGREFKQRSQYNLHHRTIHIGIRVKCLGCNKIFTRKTDLMKHQRNKRCGITKATNEID